MSSNLTFLTDNGQFKHKVSSVLNGLAEFAGKVKVDQHFSHICSKTQKSTRIESIATSINANECSPSDQILYA